MMLFQLHDVENFIPETLANEKIHVAYNKGFRRGMIVMTALVLLIIATGSYLHG